MTNLSTQIRRRKLETPAIVLLEMHKPVSRLAANGMIVFAPFLASFVGMDNVHNYSRLLMERKNIEDLICRLEEEREPETPAEEHSA